MTAPVVQDPRSDLQIHCQFDMGGEELYAVKWYKDDHEFYRYAPTGPSVYVDFPVPGVNVNKRKSKCVKDTCYLVLQELQRPYSSGSYRCEVSSEAPAFRLASRTYNITVAGNNPLIWQSKGNTYFSFIYPNLILSFIRGVSQFTRKILTTYSLIYKKSI